MRMKVVGTAGAVPFPKPGCYCEKCEHARKEGIPYARICSSLFLFPNILIDTPEGLFQRLNKFKIRRLKHVFYTHWHPDHTLGHRIFEMWVRAGHLNGKQRAPIKVYMPRDVLPELTDFLPSFSFYEKQKYIQLIELDDREPIELEGGTITPVNLKREDRVRYSYLIEEGERKVMYAPCSVYNAVFDNYWEDLDVLFLETGWHGDTQTLRAEKSIPMLDDHISLEEDFEVYERLKPKRMILTHIEGCIHQTYDFIKSKAAKYEHVDVAYDGMEVNVPKHPT